LDDRGRTCLYYPESDTKKRNGAEIKRLRKREMNRVERE